jgi:putative membrane protein
MTCLAVLSFTASAQDATPKLTDPEIASIAVTANQIDVNYGKIALKKSKNAEAKKFAETMIKDHESIIKQAVDLATKLGVTPKDNKVSQSLMKGERETNAKLNKLNGKAFDKAYIDNEVTYHEAVINTVKNVLIPQTQNEELKALLTKVSPLLEHHFEMAKMAQSKIK